MQAFIQGRDSILEFAQTPKEQVIVEVPVGKRRRGMEDEEEPRKRTRASTRQQSQSSQSQSQKERVIVVDSEDEGDEILPGTVACHGLLCNPLTDRQTALCTVRYVMQWLKKTPLMRTLIATVQIQ